MSKIDADKNHTWDFAEIGQLIDKALDKQKREIGTTEKLLQDENNKLQRSHWKIRKPGK